MEKLEKAITVCMTTNKLVPTSFSSENGELNLSVENYAESIIFQTMEVLHKNLAISTFR